MKHLHPAVHRHPLGIVLAAALLAGSACAQTPLNPRPTPKPPFGSFDHASRAELLRYARGLQFDTVQPAMGAQYLVREDSEHHLQVGPFAQLSPEVGAATINAPALDSGRIIARIVLNRPFPEAGLLAETTYVWIDSTDHGGRWLLVPTVDSAPIGHWTLATQPAGKRYDRHAHAWFYERQVPEDAVTVTASSNCDMKICTGSQAAD
jgi:hypothetical protein